MKKKGYLLLADGSLFEGELRGAQTEATAELVFTTGVVGYMETLTDPVYEGQMVVQTFPCIGSYGVIPFAGDAPKPRLSGYVVRELCEQPSNFRCVGVLDDYLKAEGIPCLVGVDTRAVTRRLRDHGTMNAAILTRKPDNVAAAAAALAQWKADVDVTAASCQQIIPAQGKGLHHVVLWDFGARAELVHEMEKRGCTVTIVPASTTAADILALQPDGVLLSDGAGDPAVNVGIISELQALCEKTLPVFGIGLGHQLLALSQGGRTVKLPYGHRGGNQPVRDVKTGLHYITSQNHGYAVDRNSLPMSASVRFVNCNDDTCEGLDYDLPFFSAQFMPEVCGGPHDTCFLFDRFIALMGGNKECR